MAKYADSNGLSHAFTVIKNWVTTNFSAITHTHAASEITNAVTGVKGNSETDYRTGNVNLTAANLGAAGVSHTHGSISSGGAITFDTTAASGDKLVISDSSDSSKLKRSGIALGNSTTTFLANNGTWQTPAGTTYSDFVGANASAAGSHGLVPAPTTGDVYKLLRGDGNWCSLGTLIYDGVGISNGVLIMNNNSVDVDNTNTLLSSTDKAKIDALDNAAYKDVDSSIASGSTSTNLPTSAAVANAISTALSDVAGALVYQGTAATASAVSGSSYKKGWYWIASASFTLWSGGPSVEAGDMIIAKQDKTSTFSNDIDVVQTNIEALTTAEIDALWAAA